MRRRSLLRVLPGILLISNARADLAESDPRLERLFGMFIAPCCWRENLRVHHSPAADDLRAEIRGYIAAGWTDERIKTHLVEAHTKRILAMPEGSQGQALSWTPWAFLAAGAALVGWWIQRSVRNRPQPSVEAGPEVSDLDLD